MRQQQHEGSRSREHLHFQRRRLVPLMIRIIFVMAVITIQSVTTTTGFQPIQQHSPLQRKTLFHENENLDWPGRHGINRDRYHDRLRRPVRRYLSSENDPEMSDEEDNEEGQTEDSLLYAPKTERDSFVSEAEVASQANQLVAATGGSTSSSHVELQDEISNSFLQYALSIIMGRAIPDARDGLKPVHRRILYAMDRLSLYPNGVHRKCARVVGEVLGKFHPHGDAAVYDALVRLAQDFSTHHLLIDGHGNFGSIDADPAAAMRYTECRLTRLSQEALLQDIQDDTVDFVTNFDGSETEPTVLPARLPLLLLNGASGIAVGMATNVPPHNLNEIMNACTALVDARLTKDGAGTVSDKELFQMVPGPDFPTGASILGTEGARKLYSTSNGGVIMRAKTEIEKVVSSSSSVSGTAKSRDAIIVTELPYQVNKASLLEKIAELVNDKKLDGIADLRDESDREGIRVVIELKRDSEEAVVLNNLYKKTSLQTTFSGNFLALMSSEDGSTRGPQRFTLRQALDCFLDFRFHTIRRRARYQFTKVKARIHVLQGLILALSKVEDVIEIIRSASDNKMPSSSIKASLDTSDAQTDAILKLQLGQLSRLSEKKLTGEMKDLQVKGEQLEQLLEVDNAVYDDMKQEFRQLTKKFGMERKTHILEEGTFTELTDMKNLVKNSRSVIVVTRAGYIKRMPLKTFESQGRGTRGKLGTTRTSGEKADNEISQCFTCNDHDMLLMVTQKGIAYGIYAYQVPTGSRVAKGQPIPSVLPIQSSDTITTVLPVSEFVKDEYIVLATEQGWIKKTPLIAFEKISARGLQIATLAENDRLNWCHPCRDGDDVLVGTSLGMASRFPADGIRPTGRTSRGVKAIKLRDDDCVADINVLGEEASVNKELVLVITTSGYGKLVDTSEFRTKSRGTLGVRAIKFKKGHEDD